MRLFVDTCVWRHWLTLKNKRPFENDVLENHSKEFDRIYEIVSSGPFKHVFLYTARIEGELPDCYLSKLPISFSKIKANSYFIKTAIPLSRADGIKADGSLLADGRFGGALRDILSMDGYDHQRALQTAVPNCKLEKPPAYTKPRRKEFDMEHLESALETDADLFITTDQRRINSLRRARGLLTDNSAVTRAYEICVTPSQALSRLNES